MEFILASRFLMKLENRIFKNQPQIILLATLQFCIEKSKIIDILLEKRLVLSVIHDKIDRSVYFTLHNVIGVTKLFPRKFYPNRLHTLCNTLKYIRFILDDIITNKSFPHQKGFDKMCLNHSVRLSY